MGITELATKVVGDKRRWRAYKARTRQLPANYRTAVEALERYFMHFGPTDADGVSTMFEDLADLFERAAADGTAIRDVVGEDPVEFAEAFLRNYSEGSWIARERERLTDAVKRAGQESGGTAR